VQGFRSAGPEQAEGLAEIENHPECLAVVFDWDEYVFAHRDLG